MINWFGIRHSVLLNVDRRKLLRSSSQNNLQPSRVKAKSPFRSYIITVVFKWLNRKSRARISRIWWALMFYIFSENGSLSSLQNYLCASDIDSSRFLTNCIVNYARCPLCINFNEILMKHFQLNRTIYKIECILYSRNSIIANNNDFPYQKEQWVVLYSKDHFATRIEFFDRIFFRFICGTRVYIIEKSPSFLSGRRPRAFSRVVASFRRRK